MEPIPPSRFAGAAEAPTSPYSYPLIVVAGPTGSGKSTLALHLANQFSGEIIGCDSVQVYRGLDIGSAKLRVAERQGIPHHLIDVAEPAESFTAGDYGRLARAALQEIRSRRRPPIVTGGTGFYLRALIDGLPEAPPRDRRLRTRLEAVERRRPGSLARILQKNDPARAKQIHPHDLPKMIRALEMMVRTGERPSQALHRRREPLGGFSSLKLFLSPERQQLNTYLDERSAALFAQGLVEETSMLLANGLTSDAKALQSLGYRQAADFLRGALSLREAIDECSLRTRQYAKRQWTWFRAEKDMTLLSGFGTDENIRTEATNLVRVFLMSFSGMALSDFGHSS